MFFLGEGGRVCIKGMGRGRAVWCDWGGGGLEACEFAAGQVGQRITHLRVQSRAGGIHTCAWGLNLGSVLGRRKWRG